MSNQDQSQQHHHHPHHTHRGDEFYATGNPWTDQQSQNPDQRDQRQGSFDGYYNAPPGPPPTHQGGHPPAPGQGPNRSGTFKETDFVPESQRGEQREAMQQFEMNKSPGNESQQDRDVAQLQQEFPGLDGSLIAALYSDAGNMGATKEMLMELANQGGQQQGS